MTQSISFLRLTPVKPPASRLGPEKRPMRFGGLSANAYGDRFVKNATPEAGQVAQKRPCEETTQWWHALITQDLKAVKQMLLQGAPINRPVNESGWTALHLAAYEGKTPLLEALLAAHADVESQTGTQQTALHLAAWAKQPVAADRLLQAGAWVDARDEDGWTPLMVAVYKNSPDIAIRLLQAGAKPPMDHPAWRDLAQEKFQTLMQRAASDAAIRQAR